jgi:hypothetical protein
MNATISVKYMLMLIIIVIILFGLAPIVTWLANQFRLQLCVQRQVKQINDINDVIEEVLKTGSPKVEKIKIDGVCAECMWYNDTNDYQQIEIKFKYSATPYVTVPWNRVSKDYGCENSNMKTGKTYTLYITPNEVSCSSCMSMTTTV